MRVPSIPDVFQQDRVQRRVGELSNGLRDAGTGGFDGDVVVLLKVNTGVLLGRILGVTEELFFGAEVTSADDVLPVPPGTEAGGLALGASVVRLVDPSSASTTGSRECTVVGAVSATGSSITKASSVATADWGRGRCPIIPTFNSLSTGMISAAKKKRYLHNRCNRGSSPLRRSPHVRWHICRFNAERSYKEK